MIYNNSRIFFIPKPEFLPALDRLMKHHATIIDNKLAQDLCKFKEMRFLRQNLDSLYVAPDRRKNMSIIYLKPNIKIRKKGNGFFFEF